jgi:hypothetical protein
MIPRRLGRRVGAIIESMRCTAGDAELNAKSTVTDKHDRVDGFLVPSVRRMSLPLHDARPKQAPDAEYNVGPSTVLLD